MNFGKLPHAGHGPFRTNAKPPEVEWRPFTLRQRMRIAIRQSRTIIAVNVVACCVQIIVGRLVAMSGGEDVASVCAVTANVVMQWVGYTARRLYVAHVKTMGRIRVRGSRSTKCFVHPDCACQTPECVRLVRHGDRLGVREGGVLNKPIYFAEVQGSNEVRRVEQFAGSEQFEALRAALARGRRVDHSKLQDALRRGVAPLPTKR